MASKRKRTVEDRVKCIRLGESGYKVKDTQNQNCHLKNNATCKTTQNRLIFQQKRFTGSKIFF